MYQCWKLALDTHQCECEKCHACEYKLLFCDAKMNEMLAFVSVLNAHQYECEKCHASTNHCFAMLK